MSISSIGNQQSLEQVMQQSAKTENQRNVGDMGKDQFIQLLITQLRYQDPLNPTQDKEFIGQMAQFSALEQMQNLNTSFNSVKASNLLGKQIEATVTEKSGAQVTVEGIVNAVKIHKGSVYAVVNEKEVLVENISSIQEVTNTNQMDDAELL